MNPFLVLIQRSLIVLIVAVPILATQSQEARQRAPWSTAEVQGCTLNGSHSLDDLSTLVHDYMQWMDEQGMENPTLLTLVPDFRPEHFPYDVLWVEVWTDALHFGEGSQLRSQHGADIQARKNEILICPMHTASTLMAIAGATFDEGLGSFPLRVIDCTFKEGVNGFGAGGVISSWSNHLSENGSRSVHWLSLRPFAGEVANPDYSFRWVTVYPSYDSLGEDIAIGLNRESIGVRGELFEPAMTCDSAQIFGATHW